jgi:26S proteasome regulatory subunit N1
LDISIARFFALGLGLLFLGQQERADAAIEALAIVDHHISKYAAVTITSLAYASSGNVLKVQELLGHCTEHLKDTKDSAWQ